MKRIIRKLSTPTALALLNIIFISLSLANIIFFAVSLDNERVDLAIKVIVPLVSAIILLFTLIQVTGANNIQNSLVTYKNEMKEIDILYERGQKNYEHHLGKFNKWIAINPPVNISYLNFCDYLLAVADHLKKKEDDIVNMNISRGQFQSKEVTFSQFYYLYNNFLTYIEDVRRVYDKINGLYANHDLVKAHYKMLCRKLYELSNQFFSFSYALINWKDYTKVHNPKILKIYDGKYYSHDLFELELVKQKRKRIEPLLDFQQNILQ